MYLIKSISAVTNYNSSSCFKQYYLSLLSKMENQSSYDYVKHYHSLIINDKDWEKIYECWVGILMSALEQI